MECARLSHFSNNRPHVRDVLVILLLAIFSGAGSCMHVNVLRHDAVNPRLLGMPRVCSDDSVRRAIARMDAKRGLWLAAASSREVAAAVVPTAVRARHRHECQAGLRAPRGAEVGYNPHKPGSPSLVVHPYLMGELRQVLDTGVAPGKQAHSMYSLPGLERLLDGMQPQKRSVASLRPT